MPLARLITIPLSHYCEKARWALDVAGVPYREEALLPFFHVGTTRRLGGRTVPILVDGERVLKDSSDIARHADSLAAPGRRLLPEGAEERQRVLALDDDLGKTLGRDARMLVYHHTLRAGPPSRALVGEMLRLESELALRIIAPVFRALMFGFYKVTPEAARRAEGRVRRTFDAMGEALGDARYLVGDRFTLADLTLASLASILLHPPEHPIMGRLNPPLAPESAALKEELSPTKVGQHVLRMYREHRVARGEG